jgi:hypothetical protein
VLVTGSKDASLRLWQSVLEAEARVVRVGAVVRALAVVVRPVRVLD